MGPAVLWHTPTTDIEDARLRAIALIDETASIEQRQSTWHQLGLWNATLYTNRELIGFRWGDANAERELWPTNLRTENLIEEIGEAMLSKASSSPLRPALEPHGRDWEVERAVRELDDFTYGVWRQTEAENACVQGFLDSFQSGLACVHSAYDAASKTLTTEAVFFDNLVIDNRECANRAMPRTYRIRKVVPIAWVEAHYDCSLTEKPTKYVDYRDIGDGWCVIVEAWRLPDAKGKGGRHSIACLGTLLADEEWTNTWVPLDFFHWQDRTSGFFTKSGVEQLVPFQVKQNNLNDTIELVQDIVCRPRLLVNAATQIDVDQWDNEAGRFLAWSGMEPKPFEWNTNLIDLYNERERNAARAHTHVGMSEMFSGADLPPQVRLDSSAGVREIRNLEDARHLRRWTRFEKFRLAVAQTQLNVLAAAGDSAGNYTASYQYGRRAPIENIKFKDALKTLKAAKYSWSLEAVPLSTMSPAARRETIRDWSSRGLIDDSEARRMEGNPNLERVEDLELASYDDIYRHIRLMERGEYEAPTELTNLSFGIKRVTQNMHRLKDLENVPPKVIANHVTWIVTAISITQAAVQQQPTMAPFAPTQGMAGTSSASAPPTYSPIIQQMGPPQQ